MAKIMNAYFSLFEVYELGEKIPKSNQKWEAVLN